MLGWAGVYLVPNQYQSQAVVFADTNTVLRPLLEGIAVQTNNGSNVDVVRRALLAREQLEQVIDKTALKNEATDLRSRETLIRELGNEIQVDTSASSATARETNIYTITYTHPDRDIAYDVVRQLLDVFMVRSVGANREDAVSAQAFLRKQVDDYARRLNESELKLAEFKKRNIGSMPDEKGGYFERLQAESEILDQLQAQLFVAAQKRDGLRTRLMGGSQPGESNLTIETSVDGRIREETGRLDELLLRFTDAHPDVIAIRQTLGRLEEQQRAERAAMRGNAAAMNRAVNPNNLVTQNLQIALNEAETNYQSLSAQVRDRQNRVGALRRQVNTLPGIEADLLSMTRDYNVTRTEYERLLQRLEQANLSDAADRSDGLRFRIINQPVKAIIPVSGTRVVLLYGVTVAALLLGVAMAWGLSLLRPVIVQPSDLVALTGNRVLGVVSQRPGMRDSAWQDWRKVASYSVAPLVLTLCLAVVASWSFEASPEAPATVEPKEQK